MLLSLNHRGLHIAEKHTDIGNALRHDVNGCGGSSGTRGGPRGRHRSPLAGSRAPDTSPRSERAYCDSNAQQMTQISESAVLSCQNLKTGSTLRSVPLIAASSFVTF